MSIPASANTDLIQRAIDEAPIGACGDLMPKIRLEADPLNDRVTLTYLSRQRTGQRLEEGFSFFNEKDLIPLDLR